MGMTFTVSDRRILTPSGLKGQGQPDWATHNRTGARAREPVDCPKLKYQFDLLLRRRDRGKPANVLRHFQRMAETNAADWFIVGGSPVSPYPFKITDISDEWGRGAARRRDGGVQGEPDHRGIFVVRRQPCYQRKTR